MNLKSTLPPENFLSGAKKSINPSAFKYHIQNGAVALMIE